MISDLKTERHSNRTKNSLAYKKGLLREFKVGRDLSKYSQTLNYKDTERKLARFTKSAKGQQIAQLVDRAKFIQSRTKLKEQTYRLKKMDWLSIKIFVHFEEA